MDSRSVKQKIVTIGASEDLEAGLADRVDRRAVGILSTPSWTSACALHETVGIDLLVLVLPLVDLPFDDFVTGLSASGLPRIVAIAREDEYRVLSQHDSDRLIALPANLSVSELVSGCGPFIRASPRTGQRIMARLEVKMQSTTWLRMVQASNISATGMKVAIRDPLPIGTWVKFSFSWPGDQEPISGDAEVVRHTSRETERVQGMGIRFTAFAGQSGQRLREHIHENVARP